MEKVWVVSVERETAEDNFIDSVWSDKDIAETRKKEIFALGRDEIGRVNVEGFQIDGSGKYTVEDE